MAEFIVLTILNGLIPSLILMFIFVLVVFLFQDSDTRNAFIVMIITIVVSFILGFILRKFGFKIF